MRQLGLLDDLTPGKDPLPPESEHLPYERYNKRPTWQYAPDWPPPVGTRVKVTHGVPWFDHPGRELVHERKFLIGSVGTVVEHHLCHGVYQRKGFGEGDGIVCALPAWDVPVVEFFVGSTRAFRFEYAYPCELEVVPDD